ncbi:hypothetical protein [Pontibacillus litoralis]|uniref:Uncharacterized protein n=1 Tax=Pontibacillus litoralis JSM 072002 TaxID=1385512 RepID=A0A0A5HWP3_9BACI|nr:hypothetical protein [Pontibacillus litoralis]KGX88022.1 hypothetical protein N784_12575 [Pontibacillus litoralis JSM 072002]
MAVAIKKVKAYEEGISKYEFEKSWVDVMNHVQLIENTLSKKADGAVLSLIRTHRKEIRRLQTHISQLEQDITQLETQQSQRKEMQQKRRSNKRKKTKWWHFFR